MHKQRIIGIAAAALLVGGVYAQELTQELTPEQMGQLAEVEQEFARQATVFEGLIQNKLTELAVELQREGRLDSEEAAAQAAKTVNTIMKELSGIYGDFIKTKVEYLLKAKNALTDEQKAMLLAEMQPSTTLPYETIIYLQPDTFDQQLTLSVEQEKKLVELEAALLIKEVELERDIELILIDLEAILLSGVSQPEKVDPLVMKLADLAAQAIDNRVGFFLKAKDTLTLEQKRQLAGMMGL